MHLRNYLFNYRILPTKTFNTPIIAVGNLNLGGVGKTPHVEYLIRLLLNNHNNIATLSRGYKRKTNGFRVAQPTSTTNELGDEPLQYYHKFKSIVVAVDEKRVNGVEQLKKHHPSLNTILLDDAYQHRSIQPGVNILITAYHKLYVNDLLFPAGTLREWKVGSKRADIIIVSKCPEKLPEKDQNEIINQLQPKKNQKVYFSFLKYGKITPHPKLPKKFAINLNSSFSILLVTGIANPTPLFNYLNDKFSHIEHIAFKDHHEYTSKDVQKIISNFESIIGNNKLIITTEKDIMRLSLPSIFKAIKNLPICYVPIEVYFNENDKKEFDKIIIDYVNMTSNRKKT